MRIPPFYRQSSWQRLFGGMAIGAIISWLVFIYIYGVLQEKQAKLLHKQSDTIMELKSDIKIWQDEFQALNKKNMEQLTVQKISVKIANGDKYDELDAFSIFEVEQEINEDLDVMKAKDLESVFKSRSLLKKAIENKTVKINDKRYRLQVKEVFIYTTLSIQVNLLLE
ncbi:MULTISPECIES: sporulation membrane protein YtrI [unclassified Bacillus (in: firmicutes)]|uniref:sporulation membrane protein YtrI n=1 Tax=unclassified Bacillus (in: firmicutes) TaxID=185979 RepID=UPI0008DEAAD7|nr:MULTISPECIES: sporulation membrane protein YtrI [unclassified Bacillus (in: firmicutes)]SFB17396.1 hypothetical protein SAMN02799634_107143 [Bacillus sp. UNCCL13]SFQ77160.1 hypothetical protein SAMN04488577_1499 [Bacillus sp. cl95]